MNRSRIFLGSTATLLAVAGIAAAKSHSFTQNVTRYYCTSAPALNNPQTAACLPYASNFAKAQTGGQTAFWTLGSGASAIQYTLYTDFNATETKCTPSNVKSCSTRLKYSGVQ